MKNQKLNITTLIGKGAVMEGDFASPGSVRIDGKVRKTGVVYLGRVIDLDKGVFCNKERGVYTYDVKTGKSYKMYMKEEISRQICKELNIAFKTK